MYRQVHEDGRLVVYVEFFRLEDAASVVETGIWPVGNVTVEVR